MIHTLLEGKWQNEPNMHRRSKARLLAAPTSQASRRDAPNSAQEHFRWQTGNVLAPSRENLRLRKSAQPSTRAGTGVHVGRPLMTHRADIGLSARRSAHRLFHLSGSFIRPGARLCETVVRRFTCALASRSLSPARAAGGWLTWSEKLVPFPGVPPALVFPTACAVGGVMVRTGNAPSNGRICIWSSLLVPVPMAPIGRPFLA
jgi:hypothetical protein